MGPGNMQPGNLANNDLTQAADLIKARHGLL